jgi:hypothetical protein
MKDQLRTFLMNNGLRQDQAELAATRCERKITQLASTGALIGFTAGIATANPGALVMAAAGAGGGAALALLSPSCQEVRDAALGLARAEASFMP